MVSVNRIPGEYRKRTATVPNMAPLAPTDGIPTSAKLPPSTLLIKKKSRTAFVEAMQETHPNIPAAKYVNRKPPDPISRSIYSSYGINDQFELWYAKLFTWAESVSWASMLRRRWIMPACRNMGVMNLNTDKALVNSRYCVYWAHPPEPLVRLATMKSCKRMLLSTPETIGNSNVAYLQNHKDPLLCRSQWPDWRYYSCLKNGQWESRKKINWLTSNQGCRRHLGN